MVEQHKLRTQLNFLKELQTKTLYAAVGKVSEWNTADTPPSETGSALDLIDNLRSIFFAKKMLPSDFTLAIRRIDWEERVFDEWNDRDPNIKEKDFYCLTSENHVYKCLSNAGGNPSTVEPTTTGTQRFQTGDGYIWKYMFTVTSDQANLHLTADYIPVKVLEDSEPGFEDQYASQIAAVPGTIDRIEIQQSGQKYNPSTTTIVITGDGSGAAAEPVINPITGSLVDVNILNPGSGYTYAQAIVIDSSAVPGTGAFLTPILSPLKGHGHNPAEELFAETILASFSLEANEPNLYADPITFRKLFILDNLTAGGLPANDPLYYNVTRLAISSATGSFMPGEKVTTSSGEGRVVVDTGTELQLSEVRGSFLPSEVITGYTSGTTATIDSVTEAPLDTFSPSIISAAYREPISKNLVERISMRFIFK